MTQTKVPWWVSLIAFALIVWGVSSCVSGVMNVGAQRSNATPWYQAGATRIMNGTLRDWYASDVTSFEREMAARGLTLAFMPHAEGRVLDTLGRRMMVCIEREGIMQPPETRTRTVAARCALGMIEP